MGKKLLNFGVSVVIGGIFLWLAIRSIDLAELGRHMGQMSYAWIGPFIVVTFATFLIRAERWKLIVENDFPEIRRSSLMGGIIFGNLVNYAIPRLGELTRTVYTAKREKTSSSQLLGTVVLERIIDLISIMVIVVLVLMYVVADRQTLQALFGPDAATLILEFSAPVYIAIGAVVAVLAGIFFWWFCSILYEKQRKKTEGGQELTGIFRIVFLFTDGLVSIRKLRRWPLFITYTVLLWVLYVMLTYIPFYAFDMSALFGLGFTEAFAVMGIATIGVMLPSPGAVGTYHWFVKQALTVLYAVPVMTGLAFAFISHAMMLFAVLLASLLFWVYVMFFERG